MTAAAYPARITVADGRIVVRAPYALKEALRAAGGWWDPARKCWMFPADPRFAYSIKAVVARATTSPEFEALLDGAGPVSGYDERYTRDYEFDIPGFRSQLWRHQRQCILLACQLLGIPMPPARPVGSSSIDLPATSREFEPSIVREPAPTKPGRPS